LAWRKEDIGMKFTMVMIERNAGMELPEEILDSEAFQQLSDVSSLIVVIMNDLMGLVKI